ncbi:GPI-anchored cell surface glycoprotein [Rasamsonia emersonii CBS 393.64]|uniref:GPI-anchored cell surface glycoprotein n=1 Tax=Rasamsonia emersonii (strain ATCC 16479 / CBS 393.64 / IMI 116815) TaxID=1408163 RepID=A0A0F4YXN8_RASE3|nr:GPI-anchored cell surface glycoprotein [Rasamsonia emersonii CBS 393.64]KKA22845.1 GPI-anchored cell surface glycoprotein [Rasamsonia emersonii CBS 393.64]
MSANGDVGHDSVSVTKKSSSLPSTPQPSSFPDSLHSAKRRRTNKSLNGDDQFIHMNGNNEGSNVGYIADESLPTSVSDSNDRREPLHAERAPKNGGLKAIQDTGEVSSSKVNRGSRMSNETSKRILKLKTGSGTSQPTIQTFIFKASRDPRASLPARSASDGPKTPGLPTLLPRKEDARSGSTQTVRSEPGNHAAGLDGGHSSTTVDSKSSSARGGRRSTITGTDSKKGSGKTIKFKNYFQTPTPNNRSARKSARIDQLQDSATSLTPSQGAATRPQSGSNIPKGSENAGSQVPKPDNQTESTLRTPTSHPVGNEDATAPAGSTPAGGPETNVSSTNESSNSVQRRSTRIRKSVGNGFSDVAKQEEMSSSAKRSVPDKPKSAKKGQRAPKDTASSGVSTPRSLSTPPKTPVPAGEGNGNDGQASSKQGESNDNSLTPSPESLLTTARISGRLRKPTLQAIEALQQKPKTRKRKLDSDQNPPSTAESSSSLVEGQQSQDTSVSATPAQQSLASTPGPEALPNGDSSSQDSSSQTEEEFLAKQLYELACAAASDADQDNDEDIDLDKLREEFLAERQKTGQAGSNSEAPSNPSQTEQSVEPPTGQPTEQHTEQSTEQSREQSTERPTEQPAEQSAEQPMEQPSDQPAEKPAEKPEVQPAEQPPEQPVEQSVPAAPANLDHPNEPRPWTDSDGWTHTGRVNEHGEEIVMVPDTYVWVRPVTNYGDVCLPPPPPQVKSRQQVERDQIFGFPPFLGQRNLPRPGPRKFVREDVRTETAKIKAREAAAQKGLSINRSMSLSDIQAKIREHDHPGSSKRKRPSLRLVLVDSRELTQNNVGLRSEGLRKRRQSAPATIEASRGQNETPSSRKRQLDGASAGKSAEPSPADVQPRKKRRSTLDPEEKTPSRQKRQSLGKASNTVERVAKTSGSNKATPKDRRHSAVRAIQSEKVSKTKAASFTPASAKQKSGEDPARAVGSPSEQGRPRRRAAAALMAQFQSQSDSKAHRASSGLKHSKSTTNLVTKRHSKGNADAEASNARTT